MLTDKQVEDGFSYEPEYEYANPTDTSYVQRNRRAFREWKAKVEREAAARALEEAAADIELGGWDHHGNHHPQRDAEAEASTWLDARAAEIREGGKE